MNAFPDSHTKTAGMSLREYLTAKNVQALMQSIPLCDQDPTVIAKAAIRQAEVTCELLKRS